MSEQTGSVVLADVIAEFLEVAFHMIIFVRGIYPPELFESTQKYSCPIKSARHPGLKSYIQQIVQAIRAELIKDSIHRICLVTLDGSTRPIDRFVFEMSTLQSFEEHIQIVQPTAAVPIATNNGIDYQLHQSYNDNDGDRRDTNVPRIDKGKSRAVDSRQQPRRQQRQHHGEEDEEGGFETDNYDGYGGDHEYDNHHRNHQVAGEEGEGEAYDEAAAEEGEEGETPLSRTRRDRVNNAQAAAQAGVQRERQTYNNNYHPHHHHQNRDGPRFGCRVKLTTDLEMMLRAMLLKISICDAHLSPLAPECSFTVVVEMKNKDTGPDAKPDFPWSPISPASHQEQLKVSAPPAQPSPQRKIIPVKTIDVAAIQLELYLEKLGS
ncbi:MAD2 mitotic arrest deficient-like 2 [Mortierella sp. NVP41]|nr:MAD2 mitotic arrest deficient-like 2 [Mortierella sp. NVP41]